MMKLQLAVAIVTPRKNVEIFEEFLKCEDTSKITRTRVAPKIKRIKTSYRKAVDSGKRSGGGRIVGHLFK